MKRRAPDAVAPAAPGAWVAGLAAAVAMAMEVLSPRVLAPFVGTTVPVWTAVIAVTLAGLALGAAAGGWLADVFPRRAIDALALALAAPALLALPALGAAAADGSGSLTVRALLGASASVLLPSVLLGAVAPAVAREAVRVSAAPARSLGRLAAVGAAGGLAGVVLAAMVFVPHVRTTPAFAMLAGVCAVAAALRGLRARARARAAEAAPSAAAAPTAPALRFGPAAALSAAVGAATLALEVLAVRSTATRFGSSLPTWASVIGAALVGLAVGAALGGRLAARRPARRLLPHLLLVSAVACALAAALEAPVALLLEGSGFSFGARAATGVCLRFLPAFIALGTVPPVLAHAVLASHARDGRRVGGISAWGTVGALAGAALTAPVLLPALGLEHAFAATAAVLLLCALAYGAISVSGRWTALAAGVTAILSAVPSPLLFPRTDLWVHDGPYARIRVDHAPSYVGGRSGALRLVLDDRAQGYQDPEDPTWLGAIYLGVFLSVAERVVPPDAAPRILCLGGGPYTLPRVLLLSRPNARVDVVEIDPVVTRAARERLALAEEPGFAVFHEDARTFVRRTAGEPRYDVVFVDTFGTASVPWHLTTREFFEALRARTAPDGVVVFNLIDVVAEGRFAAAVRETLRAVFPRVATLGAERHESWPKNVLFVASAHEVDLEGLLRADRGNPAGPPLPVVRFGEAEMDDLARRVGARVLEDEWAPVDHLMKQVYDRR